jgi:acyl-coenzyme A thioesterase 13
VTPSPELHDVPAGFEPLFRTSPFLDTLGPFYARRDGDGLVIGLRVAPKHANARGLAHGGLLLTLCDIALGYSAAYTQDPPLRLTTAHISADFAGSARVGDWVESHADVQRVGGQLAFVNVYLVVNETRIVRSSGVYLRREPHAAQGGQR